MIKKLKEGMFVFESLASYVMILAKATEHIESRVLDVPLSPKTHIIMKTKGEK